MSFVVLIASVFSSGKTVFYFQLVSVTLQSLQTQDRYVFLFNDVVIFGKGK